MTPRAKPVGGAGEVVGRVRRRLVRGAMAVLALWVLSSTAMVLLGAWLLAGTDGWTQGSSLPLVLDAILVALVAVGVWVFRWARSRWMTERRLAGSMEEAAGLGSGTLLASLELGRALPVGVSGSLAAVGERDVVRRLDLPEDRLSGRMGGELDRWSRRARAGLVVLVPLVVVVAALAPERATTAWGGLGRPLRLAAAPVPIPLDVAPGDAEVLRGADLAVRVTAPGRDSVTLHWQAAGDVARSAAAPAGGAAAGFTLREVRSPLRYWAVASDGTRSPEYRVVPVDPLFVGEVTLELAFPAYTGRAPEEYSGDTPPLAVPVGTRFTVRGRASRALEAAGLELSGEGGECAGDACRGTGVEFGVDGVAFSGVWVPRRSGVYRWSFTDAEGAPAEIAPQPLDVTLVRDSLPGLRFTFPARDTVLPLDLRQPLVLEARDDYGLGAFELVAYRVTSLGERKEPVRQAIDLGGTRAAMARPLLDVSRWGLLPGDTVRYWARVVDNHPSGQEARTREFVLRVPGTGEMRREAQERLESVARGMEDLAERAADASRESREMERQAAARENPRDGGRRGDGEPEDRSTDFRQQEDIERALERQADMEAGVDSIAAELDRLAEAMREAGLSDPGLREDLEELQRLLDEISSSEMRERLEETAREMAAADPREAREAMRRMGDEQEAFRQRLEESLERFRRAAVEQDFRATTAEAEELAREERALADAMREDPDPSSRADQQESLRERTEDMEAGMERLEQRLQQLGEQEAAREVRQAREQSAEARSSMEEAGRQARQGEGERAGQEADQASQELQQAMERLQQAQEQMARDQGEAVRRALQQTAEDALSLARRQSDLREEMRGADPVRAQDLQGDVAAVQQGVRNMAENLSVTTQSAGGGDRELSTRMGQAMDALQRTLDAMENRSRGTSPGAAAEEAVDALNQVALMAIAGAQQAGQQGQGQGQGQEGQDVQEQMEALAQQQGSLNNQAGQVIPMQLGQEALRRQLEELARGQQSVAEGLDQVADRPGSEDETLGDLDALAQEALALAEALAGGRLDAATRERQERLFHRLLDAGRSLEKDEESEERESSSAGTFERREVLPLGADAMNALRFRLPPAEVLRRLTPAERQLVIQYFERLNRRGGDGTAPPPGGGDPPPPPGGPGGGSR